MLHPGLVSVTFRNMECREIIALVREAGLSSIEWGGDVHVPQGDIKKAEAVRNMAENAGLAAAAYGSYYRVGCDKTKTGEKADFKKTMETAMALGAPVIRVWAGDKGSEEADEPWRRKILEETRRISLEAEEKGLAVAFEFHAGTLTDTNESAIRLFEEIDRDNVKAYWQPAVGKNAEYRVEGLKMLLPRLANIHAYHWEGRKRAPFEKGMDEWEKYISAAKKAPGVRHVLLEFVKDDSPAQFMDDARTLKKLTG